MPTDKLSAIFDVISSNSGDVAEVVDKFGGVANFARAAPALFRIWRTVAKHTKDGGDIEAAADNAEQTLYYGAQTKEKVRAFQTKHSLDADGIVGNQTWSKVEELTKEK